MNWLHNVHRRVINLSRKPIKLEWSDARKAFVIGLKMVNIACVWHLVFEHVGGIRAVSGPSMLPTMEVEDELIVENRMVSIQSLQRGDLVTFMSPLDPTRGVCKRIIGFPGDIICVDPTGKYAPSTEHVVVPKGHIWVSGDNMSWSRDSREYGPIPVGLIKGKFIGRVWPLRRAAWFSRNFQYIDE